MDEGLICECGNEKRFIGFNKGFKKYCEKCGRTFEYFQSMSDETLTICQECQGPLKRLIGGGLGIIFKGSGFYVTDNKGKNSNNTK
jgi:putative FmdB family regulatory protein